MIPVRQPMMETPELTYTEELRERERRRRAQRRETEIRVRERFRERIRRNIVEGDEVFQNLESVERRGYELLNGLVVEANNMVFRFRNDGYDLEYSRGTVDGLVFLGCQRLKSIVFKHAVVVHPYAFKECGVTSVTFEKLAILKEGAFYNSGVRDVEFMRYCEIGALAFYGCDVRVVYRGVSRKRPNSFSGPPWKRRRMLRL